jgi:hypothetical protein
MWMEEQIGTRINMNRTTEAVGTGADQIAVGCPFCRVMLSDGLTTLQSNGEAREEVEVLDVAQLLLESVKRPAAKEAVVEEATQTGDAEADDTQYPLTVAHDGTVDPEEGAAKQPDEEPQPEPQPVAQTASPVTEATPEATAPVETNTTASTAPAAGTSSVIEVALPAGVATVAETYAGRDVESILEGDDVDISEFKAALKEELKAEVLAEVKAELEGALNSPTGTSEPVRAEATSSTGSAAADEPEAEAQTDATPAEAEASEEASAGADKLDQEAEPEAAVEAPTADDSGSDAEVKTESKPTAESADAEKAEKKDDGDDGPLLIGSL